MVCLTYRFLYYSVGQNVREGCRLFYVVSSKSKRITKIGGGRERKTEGQKVRQENVKKLYKSDNCDKRREKKWSGTKRTLSKSCPLFSFGKFFIIVEVTNMYFHHCDFLFYRLKTFSTSKQFFFLVKWRVTIMVSLLSSWSGGGKKFAEAFEKVRSILEHIFWLINNTHKMYGQKKMKDKIEKPKKNGKTFYRHL